MCLVINRITASPGLVYSALTGLRSFIINGFMRDIDGYDNVNGLGLTEADAVDYIQFLSTEAHARGLAIGLKNAMGILSQVMDVIEFGVNEQCMEYQECGDYDDFLASGRPVLHIEYPNSAPDMTTAQIETACSNMFTDASTKSGFNTILKTMDLDGWAAYCDGTIISS